MSHGGGGGDRWLVSYSDLITVLMILFVVLYAMGQTDIERYKQLAQSLKVAFGDSSYRIVDPEISQYGGVDDDSSASPIVISELPESDTSTRDVASEIQSAMANIGLGGDVQVQENIEGILISMSEKLLFNPGTADLQPQGYEALDAMADLMGTIIYDIRVTGHTDANSIPSAEYSSNWELSVARSVKIVEYLASKGISPERMTAAGQAEYHPLYSQDGPNALSNSRAEITIVYPVTPKLFDFDLFSPTN